MTLSKETLEEIAELARKATYKPCAMHITNLVARCDSEVVEELIRELLERRERDKQEPVAYMVGGYTLLHAHDPKVDEYLTRATPLYAAPQLPPPAVVSNASRENFEAWARSAGFNENWYFFTNTHPNHYDDDHINDMWAAWNACCAAMLSGGQP